MQLIGKYVVHRLIATTGTSRIFQCLDPDLQVAVAIKLFDPNPQRMPKNAAVPAEILHNQFLLEARTLASFDHPHVIAIKQFARLETGQPYFVMPYMQANLPYEIGRDSPTPEAALALPERERPRALPPARALTLLRQVLSALVDVHAKGLVHRDVKPTNLLLSAREGGYLKLCDFGVVRRPDESNAPPAALWSGSADYRSPEQNHNATDVDARADVYSAAVLGYRLLTGHLPQGDFPPPRDLVPALPAYVSALLMAALRPDPGLRPKHAGDMLQRLSGPPKPQVRVVSINKAPVPPAPPSPSTPPTP